LFLKRIFRSTNLAVWQKRREKGFEHGLVTTLLVLMVGPKNFWIGHAGNTSAWLYHKGTITKLTNEDIGAGGTVTKAVGIARLGLTPHITTGILEIGDTILLATAGVADVLTEKEMRMYLDMAADNVDDIQHACEGLVACAKKHTQRESLAVVMIKRTP
jgi:serine/threonine protein phosphatase PrpC